MKHIVVDTGYLLHLFDVDDRTDPMSRDHVRTIFKKEAASGSIFYVTVPVIFELCNFVSQVSDGASRRRLAANLRDAVAESLSSSVPWTITPFEGDDSMRDWVEVLTSAINEFSEEFAHQEIGLTDLAVLRCANKIKSVVRDRPNPKPLVHIWTVDGDLKAREPDVEAGAFLGH